MDWSKIGNNAFDTLFKGADSYIDSEFDTAHSAESIPAVTPSYTTPAATVASVSPEEASAASDAAENKNPDYVKYAIYGTSGIAVLGLLFLGAVVLTKK